MLVNPFTFRYIDDVGREVRPNEARLVYPRGLFCLLRYPGYFGAVPSFQIELNLNMIAYLSSWLSNKERVTETTSLGGSHKMGNRIEIEIFDRPDGSRIIELYDRKQGDLKRRNRAVKKGKVSHDDQKQAKNLVKEKDAESWQRLKNGDAGDNPDIILDPDSGAIIFRPVKQGGKAAGKPIETTVTKEKIPPDLYDRLRHARFMTNSGPIVSILNGLIENEPYARDIVEAAEHAIESLYDIRAEENYCVKVEDVIVDVVFTRGMIRVRVLLPPTDEIDDLRQ